VHLRTKENSTNKPRAVITLDLLALLFGALVVLGLIARKPLYV
jgi:hypothetical protein